jgi:hypothetical protein
VAEADALPAREPDDGADHERLAVADHLRQLVFGGLGQQGFDLFGGVGRGSLAGRTPRA